MVEHTRRRFVQVAGSAGIVALAGCAGDGGEATQDEEMTESGSMTDESMEGEMTDEAMDDEGMMAEPTDPADAERATVDRFSEAAGTLMVRGEGNDLPGPGEPVTFDEGPFLTTGLGPDGGTVQYYNFDVQPTAPAPIYVFVREGEDAPVDGQRNVLGTVPGDEGYNDFWHVHRVTVPADYEANVVTSAAQVMEADYDVQPTGTIKNCPVVPAGSTAAMRGGDADAGLVDGWYEGQIVSYFLFEEAPLAATDDGTVPTSPIYVSFNTNPGMEGGGPASGFVTEDGSGQTHNVLATVPGDAGYSPLWSVNVYDNADFGDVSDLESATSANVLAMGTATVNCPVVSME